MERVEYYVCSHSFAKKSEEWLRQWVRGHCAIIKTCIPHSQTEKNDMDCAMAGLVPEGGFKPNMLARLISGNADSCLRRIRNIIGKRSPGTTRVGLIHFVNYAVDNPSLVKALLHTCEYTFIHCHGADVTWDLCDYDGKKGWFFSSDYPQKVCDYERQGVKFFACSDYVAGQLRSIGVKDESIVIKPIGVAKVNAAAKLSSGLRSKDMCFVGRMIACKGPDTVIKVFARFVARNPSYAGHLYMVGAGPMFKDCQMMAQAEGLSDRIHFPGWLDHDAVSDVLRKSGYMLCGHRKDQVTNQIEAYGVSLIEAAALGLPIVGLRIGGPGEILDSLYPEWLVAEGAGSREKDIDALTTCLERWLSLNDEEAKDIMGRAAEKVEQCFSLQAERAILLESAMCE